MLFNSFEFAVFLPIVFLLYWYVFKKNLKAQNSFIVIASYVFYGWLDWRFLFLIFFTTILTFFSGSLINNLNNANKHKKAKIVSTINIILNLLILGFFKYYNFFIIQFVDAFAIFNIHLQITTLNLILPVGISFYTFQSLTYSIDVYRKKLEPTKDIIAFFAFVSFFPQLLAGPIGRATELIPQFLKERKFDYSQAVDGCRQILWGLFKKVVVADTCAIYVNEVFASYNTQTASTLVIASILFTFQIYGDFSGYSDIAIGVAKLFCIKLMRNFNVPYFSRNVAEFWRRWHISLNSWFRDYIYIPLGGSREGKWKSFRNTFIIFTVCGFWHGANWTFIVWGIYHALLFAPLLLLGNNKKYKKDIVAENSKLPSIKECGEMLWTFILINIGWIIFKADNISSAFNYIVSMFSLSIFTIPIHLVTLAKSFIWIFIMIIVEWIQRKKEHGLDVVHVNKIVKWLIYYSIIILVLCNIGAKQQFIYFQF